MTEYFGTTAMHAAAQQTLFVSGAAAGIFALGADPAFTVRLTMRAIHQCNALAFGEKGIGAFLDGAQTTISIAGLQAYDAVKETAHDLGDHALNAVSEMRAFLAAQIASGASGIKSICQHIAVDTRRWMAGAEAQARTAAETANAALGVLTRIVETWGVVAGLREMGAWISRRKKRTAGENDPTVQKIEIHVSICEQAPKALAEKMQGETIQLAHLRETGQVSTLGESGPPSI